MIVGALLCEPADSSCAAGAIFFNNVGYLGMCGHGMIGLVVTLAYLGKIIAGEHRIETPVGIVGAHVYGQNLVGNEAYTWLRSPRYLTTLQDLKVGSDVNFLAGVNVIIGHGFSYSPDDTDIPGWSYYAGVYFHPKNTWWPYIPLLMKYVQRVSYILREGIPVADVALLLPEDDEMADCAMGQLMRDSQKVIVKLRLGRPGEKLPKFDLDTALRNRSPVVSTLVTNGYNFDGVNNDALQAARIENRRLRVGLGNYGVLVLPSIKGVPVETMEKISAFARAGGRVIAIGQAPSLCYGLPDWRAKSARVCELAASVFNGGRGRIVPDADDSLLAALRASHPPHVDFERADPEVGFLHRHTPTHDVYFISNTSAEPKRLRDSFRVGRRAPEFWDSMTGRMAPANEYSYGKTGTVVPLRLEPYASVIVAFGQSEALPPKRRAGKSPQLPPAVSVRAPWRLEIDGASLQLDALHSWTEYDQFRFFSGSATYHAAFNLDRTYLANQLGLMLHFGKVHEIANVEVNQRAAGVAWMAHYQLDISGYVQAGENQPVVKVTNLLINRVLGAPKPDTHALLQKFADKLAQEGAARDLKFERNREKDRVREPLYSGLFGPVEICPFWRDRTALA